ncbi:MAG: hypothetical protein R2752_07275 [Vicinamibacterales bacterium]
MKRALLAAAAAACSGLLIAGAGTRLDAVPARVHGPSRPSSQPEPRPDFSGTWRRVSGAVAPAQETIAQTASALTIETAGFPKATCRFDGTETRARHEPPLPPDSVVTTSYRCVWDGARLVATIGTETDLDGYKRLAFRQETRSLDDDGHMVVENRPFTILPMGGTGSLDHHPPMTLTTSRVRTTVYERRAYVSPSIIHLRSRRVLRWMNHERSEATKRRASEPLRSLREPGEQVVSGVRGDEP